ncbi:hypothetical protein ACN469_16970 [Corallococcus terminator]
MHRPSASRSSFSLTLVTVLVALGVLLGAPSEEINEGKAKKGNESGVMTWTLNRRTYGDHDGTLYPIRGDGVHELNRGAFRALGLYNDFKDTPRAREYMDKMKLPEVDRKAGLKAYKAG